MTRVLEHELIGRLAAGLPRSPSQLNRLHESDAELVRLPGSDLVLALTTDALAEEIATGLYRDPWLIGWMLVTVNASDLAAVGADPLGLLICETLPPDADEAWIAAAVGVVTAFAVGVAVVATLAVGIAVVAALAIVGVVGGVVVAVLTAFVKKILVAVVEIVGRVLAAIVGLDLAALDGDGLRPSRLQGQQRHRPAESNG